MLWNNSFGIINANKRLPNILKWNIWGQTFLQTCISSNLHYRRETCVCTYKHRYVCKIPGETEIYVHICGNQRSEFLLVWLLICIAGNWEILKIFLHIISYFFHFATSWMASRVRSLLLRKCYVLFLWSSWKETREKYILLSYMPLLLLNS